MTAAQRVMATALLYLEPEKGGRGKKSSVTEEFGGTGRLSMVRAVLRPRLALDRQRDQRDLVAGKQLGIELDHLGVIAR